MEIILFSTIVCISYMLLLLKTIKIKLLIKMQLFFDILFTIGLPLVMSGTWHGMAVAMLAGLMFTANVWLLTKLYYFIYPAERPKDDWPSRTKKTMKSITQRIGF